LLKSLTNNNMLNFKTIAKIFLDFLNNSPTVFESDARLSNLIRSNIEINQKYEIGKSVNLQNLNANELSNALDIFCQEREGYAERCLAVADQLFNLKKYEPAINDMWGLE